MSFWIAFVGSPVLVIMIQSIVAGIKNRHDNQIKELNKKLESINKKIDGVDLSLLRLQILNLIQHDPKNKVAIQSLYDKYTEFGGNSYITDLVNKWKKNK